MYMIMHIKCLYELASLQSEVERIVYTKGIVFQQQMTVEFALPT